MNFLQRFDPEQQKIICSSLEECYSDKYPTLSRIKIIYGRGTAESWLMAEVSDLSEYTNTKKISPRQNEELAASILLNYGYMTIAQIMLFFLKFKSGEYGKFYGSVDALVISDALNSFKYDRMRDIDEIEKKKDKKIADAKKEWSEKHAVSREECNELIARAKNGDQEAIKLLQPKPNE
jgi:hypothetical protein